MTKTSIVVVSLLCFCFVAGDGGKTLRAQGFLKDLITKSPGPLAKPHEAYDAISGCIECHNNRLGGEIANEKCFTCHAEIKERIDSQRGYHWNKTLCKDCHTEHKGKNHDIFAPKNWLRTFDHEDTGYPLLGKHEDVACEQCHTTSRANSKTEAKSKTRTFLDAPTQCIECHRKDYEHKFSDKKLENCTYCHSEQIQGWKTLAKRLKFDHSKTRYPLEGLHLKVECNECHTSSKMKNRVTTFAPLKFSQCTDCHADPHKGSFGNNCTDCHNVYRKWTNVIRTKAAPAEKKADPTTAEAGFDHSRTQFPLTGYHQAVACENCHYETKGSFKIDETKFDECSDCHGLPHGSQFSGQRCESCHATERRYTESLFDLTRHNKLSFPLDGRHQVIDCNKCHYSGQFENMAHNTCDACHRNPHDKRQIDKECSFCHVTTSFSWIQFDHNRTTNFALTGKHRDVACTSCHLQEIFKNMPATNTNPNCQACHADPHGNAMSNECASCHRTEGFQLVQKFDHQKIGGWPLDGRHSELSCQKCHSSHLLGEYKVPISSSGLKATQCANCHWDVHRGKMGTACESCHTMESFAIHLGNKVHDLGFFALKGVHSEMACSECHRPDTNLQGTGEVCGWCHEKDDPHLGQFGDQCGDCHKQESWLPTTFKHTKTGFRLTGAHRYVECSSCHVNQVYQGLPSDCYFCHLDSRIDGVSAHTSSVQECSDCHSTLTWKARRGNGLQ